MMKAVAILVITITAGFASSNARAQISEFLPGGPSPEVVAVLEEKVSMPDGAKPISSYLRTYFPYEGKVVGYYRASERADPSRPDSAPVVGIRSSPVQTGYVFDGGCDFVTVIYDPASDTVEGAYCNGLA
jgi:hypothetical protein